MNNCCTVQSKTLTDLENIKPNKLKPNNCVNNHKANPVKSDKIMPLEDNIFYIIDKPSFDQNLATRNKKLIFINFFCLFNYSQKK